MELKKIKEIANSIMFDASDEVLKDFNDFFEKHLIQITKLQKINTNNIKPMIFVDETPKTFLREDVLNKEAFIEKNVIFKNAINKANEFIVIPKEGEND